MDFGPDFIASLNAGSFEAAALQLFRHQYSANALYRQWADALKSTPAQVHSLRRIPFLPISFFKTHSIATGVWEAPEIVFRSSGTTGGTDSRSTHRVRSAAVYKAALLEGFKARYGSPRDWAILALLPSYLERNDSSLVYMADCLMQESGHAACGFFLDDTPKLADVINTLEAFGQKTLLIGVTFALLDFAQAFPMPLRHTAVMETGGMKGRREEWTRAQVHQFLKDQWGLAQVHSEYGMTELLSQAYAPADGLFHPAPTLRAFVRDIADPLETFEEGRGVLNMVDLANIHSCAFIATEDLGTVYGDGTFEVLGRLDHSALRGCSLMTA